MCLKDVDNRINAIYMVNELQRQCKVHKKVSHNLNYKILCISVSDSFREPFLIRLQYGVLAKH
jgi:hypothetical protein